MGMHVSGLGNLRKKGGLGMPDKLTPLYYETTPLQNAAFDDLSTDMAPSLMFDDQWSENQRDVSPEHAASEVLQAGDITQPIL